VNSVMLSGYLKISELNRFVYAVAASAYRAGPWECNFRATWYSLRASSICGRYQHNLC
jgi:hypothetical protein